MIGGEAGNYVYMTETVEANEKRDTPQHVVLERKRWTEERGRLYVSLGEITNVQELVEMMS